MCVCMLRFKVRWWSWTFYYKLMSNSLERLEEINILNYKKRMHFGKCNLVVLCGAEEFLCIFITTFLLFFSFLLCHVYHAHKCRTIFGIRTGQLRYT